MTLTYEFVTDSYPYEYNGNTDSWDETEEFEYDPSYSELLEFYNILSKEEFISGCEHAFSSLSEEDKEFFLNPDNGYAVPKVMNGDEFNWEAVYENVEGLKDDFISELLFDDIDYFDDELHSYFEDAAKAAYDDRY